MKWFEKCLLELTHHNMFESTEHRSRFLDLISCYSGAAFFTKGLCKCMYLSSWDDDHFGIMLDTLNHLVIENVQTTGTMAEQGDVLSQTSVGTEAEIYKLSTAFLAEQPYTCPDLTTIDPDCAYIIRKAVQAGHYIDDLPDPHESASL